MEYPHLVALHNQFKDRGFVVLSIETSNRAAMAKEFTTSVGANFPIVIDDQEVTGKVFGVHATPTNMWIDPNGTILFSHVGFTPGDEKNMAATIDYMLTKREQVGAVTN